MLDSLRPRHRDIPFVEQAWRRDVPDHTPLALRIALAVTCALDGEITSMRSQREGFVYRKDVMEDLGKEVGITERTLRRLEAGQRWVTIPELERLVGHARMGERLRERFRTLGVSTFAPRPNLADVSGSPVQASIVEGMEDDVSTGSAEQSWDAPVPPAIPAEPAPPATLARQLRSQGLSIVELVREVLRDSGGPTPVRTIWHGVNKRARVLQAEHDWPLIPATRRQITEALTYLRAGEEVESQEGEHTLVSTVRRDIFQRRRILRKE
ncbi:hypothetical protein BJF80_13190 [Serinicoccus sp. CUA-874]|uniref:hypothetical protein n=1 Tax=Serinicoccus sp. CUA-874 TaxID=1517939 RepID=UPI000964ACBA|nr:hypothetical protein [Serinicoccus sp. CUA-874]OLT19008.1 hypothetical protein BJF80_13190 [Serinicoccus sp. CUA-874]